MKAICERGHLHQPDRNAKAEHHNETRNNQDNGRPTVLNPQLSFEPIALPEALVLSANYARKFKITVQEGESVFVVALKPRQAYEIEVDDEEMREEWSDPGGILSLQLPSKVAVGVRMREAKK